MAGTNSVGGIQKKLTNKRGVVEKLQLLEVQKTVKMQFLTIWRLKISKFLRSNHGSLINTKPLLKSSFTFLL